MIYRQLGAGKRNVIVGPRFGVDNAVVRIATKKVMVATADPLSFIPALGARDSAWLSVNLIASDLTTSGFQPQYGVFDFNLPPRMPNRKFTDYWTSFHNECKRLGLAIIGGHTGRYEGCDYTVIGAGVMYAVGDESKYLTSEMGQIDDDIILTKGAAIETTAVLTRAFPKTVRRALGDKLFERAQRYLRKVSTVKDALTVVTVGVHKNGVTSMHDATEGGVIAATCELAAAARLGAELDLKDMQISEETEGICKVFGIDPLTSLSEGSLVLTSNPRKTSKIIARLKLAKIEASVIGQLTKPGAVYSTRDKVRKEIKYPRFDPYWKAYSKATTKQWK
ncbi:MAG: AIR synthase-related protein [Candidatus Bathyarchaeia archaeon]